MALAQAMAERVSTEFVSLAERDRSYQMNALPIRVVRGHPITGGDPLGRISLRVIPVLARAHVIHCHQFTTPVTDLALLLGALLRKKVFVTPLGGGSLSLSYHVNLGRLARAFLHISEYSRTVCGQPARRNEVIYGGVDTRRFSPGPRGGRREGVLFVGRILPHKGVDYLVEAMPAHVTLRVVGPPYSAAYLGDLRHLAEGKCVRFILSAEDDELVSLYRRSAVLVLPSVYLTRYGQWTAVPELLGQTLLEAMACGTPVLCTDVGAMPEVVKDGITGFVVPPNDPAALRDRIEWLLSHPKQAEEMGRAGRRLVLERFTWGKVAERCLQAYRGA